MADPGGTSGRRGGPGKKGGGRLAQLQGKKQPGLLTRAYRAVVKGARRVGRAIVGAST